MNETAQQIMSMLTEKSTLDAVNANANNMASYDRWIADAVTLLLRIELERQK